MAKIRFLFSTDLHGSEVVWRKFLNSAKIFDLDALVISGDMTGKMIIPIFKQADGNFKATIFGEESILKEGDLPEYEKKIDGYGQKIKKYDDEKTEIRKKAEDLEKIRDEAQKHSGAFGLAAMFLQIAILLSSIAALMKRKLFWFLGMAAGCFGLVYFFNGFFLFMK